MSLPKLLTRLFQNDGGGALLNESLMPNNVLHTSGGTMTGRIYFGSQFIDSNSDGMLIGASNSAFCAFRNSSYSANPMGFEFFVGFGTSQMQALSGGVDGTLKWDGKEVERVIATYNNGSLGYIHFASGLKVQWRQGSPTALNNGTVLNVTLPMAFSSSNYFVFGSCAQLTFGASSTISVGNQTTTSFDIYQYNEAGAGMAYMWLAIGY